MGAHRRLDFQPLRGETRLRPLIVIGDRTSHGGVVIGSSTTTDSHGRGLARVGDQVACPKRGHGTSTIVSGDPTMLVDGAPVARHGDLCSCGAVLIASQSFSVMDEDSGSDHAKGGSTDTRSVGLFSALVPEAFEFDIHFVVRDESSGQPLAGVSYLITLEDGTAITGVTDQDGLTDRIGANMCQRATLEVHHHGHEGDGATDARIGHYTCSC